MIIIDTVNSTRFSIDGVPYLKNYISEVAGNQITIFNAYDRKDIRIDWTHYGNITLNGVVYGNSADLQSNLLPVIYTRASLGGASGVQSIVAGTNITVDDTDPKNPIISSSGGGGGAVDSVNSQTGVVSIDLESVLTEGNESTTQDAIFRLDANKYIKINRASQKIELWDESIDDTIPITHWDKDSIYIKDATGNQMSISAGYTNNLTVDGSSCEIFGSNIVLTNAGTSLNLTNEQMELNDGVDAVAYRVDKIVINGVDYPLPTGATSQIATLLDIPSPITIDATPTDGSSNAVSSNGVFDALALKQDKVTGVSDTEIGYLDGVTSAIQTQLNNRVRYLVKDTAVSSAVTGTLAETLAKSYTIPANTLGANDYFRINCITTIKTGTADTSIIRVRISNTNTFAGSSLISTTAHSATAVNMKHMRDLAYRGGVLKGVGNTTTVFQDKDRVTTAYTSTTIDFTQAVYVFVSIQNANIADSTVIEDVLISN